MYSEQELKTKALMDYLYKDYQQWKAAEREAAHARGELIWNDPDEKEYCTTRLHVPYESFNRWKNRNTPVSEINLLRIAISLGDETPFRIYGFAPLPRDLWDILVRLPSAEPQDLKAIRSVLPHEDQEEDNVMIPAG